MNGCAWNSVSVLASYKSWKCEVVDKKQSEGLMPGDLVEFEFHMKEDLVIITKLVNHKVPSHEEFDALIQKYKPKQSSGK